MSELDQYDYELPRRLIAQEPVVARADARMMVVNRVEQSITHRHVRDLPELLRPGDCLALNDTKVVPARLIGRRNPTGGRWEGLFLESDTQGFWRILLKAKGRLVPGSLVTLVNTQGQDDIQLELAAKEPDGSWIAKPDSTEETIALLERVGRVPLPPYIRGGRMMEGDREHYQTVYARNPGAVAAPTAGLHFTEALLNRLAGMGVGQCRLTLHVGAGTFRQITSESLADHQMHAEWGTISQEAVDQLAACRRAGGRAVAVGTTSVRVLETAAAGGTLQPFTGRTELFIHPPYQFRAVDVLMTNFHLPKTTLLVLVRVFGGDDLIRRAYDEAIREEYRFFSYGDAMLVV
jgi:S-adenosylmethionine:tRNA ribosyltransferase-isomerase